MDFAYLLVGIGIGGVAAWVIASLIFQRRVVISPEELEVLKGELSENQVDVKVKEDLLCQAKETEQSLKGELSTERAKVIELSRSLSSKESDYKNLLEKLNLQKQEIEDLQKKFTTEFKNLANEIFEEKSKKFTDQNKVNLTDLLNPLREKITEFEKKVEQNSKDSIAQNSALKEQITSLKELNLQITKEAENLTKALKGDSKTQGNWGEMQLETILEKVGLEKGIHYEKEKVFKNTEGQNQRLDYIINLPDNKYLVIDSKVSLTAYSNYFDAEDELDKQKFLKAHINSVNEHIRSLSEKNYQNLYDIQQPDYILMFIANEPALTIALKNDHALYEKALDKNIVLVSTSTLLATLRTISYIWKQDLQNKNALEIARQSGSLYDKFTAFTEDLLKLGGNLESTKKSYDTAMNKLVNGKDNLVRKTERLRELGAKSSKVIDQRLLNRSEDTLD